MSRCLPACLIFVGFCATILAAGCQAPSAAGVLDPLPAPAYVRYEREPTPYLPEPPAQIVEQVPRWMPRAGLKNHWRYIVIHHSDSHIGSVSQIDSWHRQKGWENGCGYHFVIGNGAGTADGQVEMSQRWHLQLVGAHCRLREAYARQNGVGSNYYNEHGIGIVLVGKFNDTRPTPRQMASLVELVRFLMDTCNIPPQRVVGHGDVDETECPGLHFSMPDFRLRLADAR